MGKRRTQIPGQLLLGILFMVFGALFLLKKIGRDYVPFIPEDVFIYVCAVGSMLGGFYMIIKRLFGHRIYLH
jgi:hypothetical protein